MEKTSNSVDKNVLSYEDLKQVAAKQQEQLVLLNKEYNALASKFQEAMESLVGKRLELLFKVLDHKEMFSQEVVTNVVETITTILLSSQEQVADTKEEQVKESNN